MSRARSVVSKRKGRVKSAGAGDSVSDVADVGGVDGASRGEWQHSWQGGVRDLLDAVLLAAEVDDVWERWASVAWGLERSRWPSRDLTVSYWSQCRVLSMVAGTGMG